MDEKDNCAVHHWATNGEVETSDTDTYRNLYYSCVERCSVLQHELLKYSGLLPKYTRIAELKDQVLSGIEERVQSLAVRESSLQLKEKSWTEKMAATQQQLVAVEKRSKEKEEECRSLRDALAASLVSEAIVQANNQLNQDLINQLKARKSQAEKQKMKFTNYSKSLKKKYKDMKESYEFIEAERDSYEETIRELEEKVRLTTEQLQRDKRMAGDLKSGVNLEPEDVGKGSKLPEALSASIAACGTCCLLKTQLELVTDTLNGKNLMKYGDMLHTNFVLRQKLSQVESELSDVTSDYERLGLFFSEYKEKSMEKMAILKENVKKADEEIAELDRLVESVIEELQANVEVVKDCPQLMQLILELGQV